MTTVGKLDSNGRETEGDRRGAKRVIFAVFEDQKPIFVSVFFSGKFFGVGSLLCVPRCGRFWGVFISDLAVRGGLGRYPPGKT